MNASMDLFGCGETIADDAFRDQDAKAVGTEATSGRDSELLLVESAHS
jgi:hypothetical protein